MLIEAVVVAPQPREHHGGVLDLLAHVVQQHSAQVLVAAGVGALAVPVHRLQLLLQGDQGAVHVDGVSAQVAAALVQGVG